MLNKIHRHHSIIQSDNTLGQRKTLFRLGEAFLGQVLECHGKSEVTVAAKGARFRAYTTLPLVRGNRYEFFVQQEQPQLILKVVHSNTSEPSQLLSLWGVHAASRASVAKLLQNVVSLAETSTDLRQVRLALEQLRDLLPGVVCSGPDSLNARWLAQQLSSLGLFWESKVARWLEGQGTGKTAELVAADLKGILLALMERLDQSDAGGPNQDLKAVVTQTLGFVELQQRLNLLGGPEPGQWFWFIPIAEDQGLRSVEVFVEEPGEERGDPGHEGTFRLRLRVELSRLGPIEAAVSLHQERISCQLRVPEKMLADWITSKLPELKTALRESGFQVAFLGCEAGKIQQLHPLLLSAKGQGSALVCVVV